MFDLTLVMRSSIMPAMLFTVNNIAVLFTFHVVYCKQHCCVVYFPIVNSMASELGLCNLQCHYPEVDNMFIHNVENGVIQI